MQQHLERETISFISTTDIAGKNRQKLASMQGLLKNYLILITKSFNGFMNTLVLSSATHII